MSRPHELITFLSDYGLSDGFVGVCHGVMSRIAPGARIVDLAHNIEPFQIVPAALLLRNSLPYFEPGVHIAVVDPGVGTGRGALAARSADGRLLVGPDNGILMPALDRLGGITEVVDIGESPYRLDPVSATFHGRDIFCPVGASLAAGRGLEEVGVPCDQGSLLRLDLPEPAVEPGRIGAEAVSVDGFGNIALNAVAEDMARAGLSRGDRLQIAVGVEKASAPYCDTFADVKVGEPAVFEDSFGQIAIAVNQGSAKERLKAAPGSEVTLSR